MKWFNFLTGKAGKIVLGTGQMLALSAVVGVGVTSLMYNASSKAADERLAARALSGISDGYQYEGLQQRDGMLTSINVGGGEVLATPEEIAAREGYNDFGSTVADGAEADLAYSIGNAAQFNATEGFGQDKDVDVSMPDTRASVGGGSNAADANGVYGAAPTASSSTPSSEPTDRPQLSSTSMARSNASGGTSGNVYSTASGANGAGHSSAGKPSPSREASGSGYQFSGAMPSGSSSMGLGGANSGPSPYMAGGRYSTVGKRRHVNRVKGEVEDVAKISSEVAKNKFRASNEGSKALLAGYKLSGGIDVSSPTELNTTESTSFDPPPPPPPPSQIGDTIGETVDDSIKKHKTAKEKVLWWMLGLTAATVLATTFGYLLIANGRRLGGLLGGFMIAAGILLILGTLVTAGFLIDAAVQYGKEYLKPSYTPHWLTWGSFALATVSTGFMAYTLAKAFTVGTAGGKTIPLEGFFAKTAGVGKKMAVMAGKQLATNVINKTMSDSPSDSARS